MLVTDMMYAHHLLQHVCGFITSMSLSLGFFPLDVALSFDLLYFLGNIRVIDVGDKYWRNVGTRLFDV